MSKCSNIITFSEFKTDFVEPQIFGNDWGLFIDLDEDIVKTKENYVSLDVETDNKLYDDGKNHTNNYFDYLYECFKITTVIIISVLFIFIIFYV
jgi:hypothetical protein